MASLTKRFARTFSTLSLLLVVAAGAVPASGAIAQNRPGCVTSFGDKTDYFSTKAIIEHAIGFTIDYRDHYKVVTIHDPNEEGVSDVIVLVQCGAPTPQLTGDLESATVVTIPARTLGANEDLSLNRARVLGYTDQVVAMGGGGIYATDLRKRWETGAALAIGESFHGQPDYEKVLAASPDVVFLSTASLARADSIERARSMGIAAIPSMSWIEPTVLGQAEWLHLIAAFLNEEATANAILDDLKSRYISLSEKARAQTEVPTLVWLDPARQRNKWTVPEANWLATLVEDAGGRTPWASSNGAPERIVATEQILAIADEVSAFVTESIALREPGSLGALESAPAAQRLRVYDVHNRSRQEHDAYDWYESAVVEVDRVLEDFVALLHPDVLPGHRFRYLRAVRADESAP